MPFRNLTSVIRDEFHILNINNEDPYVRNWVVIGSVSMYAGLMVNILLVSSGTIVEAHETIIYFIMMSTAVFAMILYISIPKENRKYIPIRGDYLSPILLSYPFLYALILDLASEDLQYISSVTEPTFLISILQALLLTLIISMFCNPIKPRRIDQLTKDIESLQFYFDGFYKSMNFVFSAIIAYAIGVVVSYSLDDSIANSSRILAFNILATFPLPILIGIYMSRKHSYVMQAMRDEISEEGVGD